MGNKYSLLNWDTSFFGYKIACLLANDLNQGELMAIIHQLKDNNYRLLYCFTKPIDEVSNESMKSASGFLVDEKVTFIKKLNDWDIYMHSESIKPYELLYPSEKLKLMALQSGVYSRYKIDINFRNNEYEKLYLKWIEESVKKTLASDVLVYYKDEDEKGFVTIKINNVIGSIGLIAVDQNARGNSIGKELMMTALNTFQKSNVEYVEVVTQRANKIACNFYSSLGFNIKNTVNVYHLWIK